MRERNKMFVASVKNVLVLNEQEVGKNETVLGEQEVVERDSGKNVMMFDTGERDKCAKCAGGEGQ